MNVNLQSILDLINSNPGIDEAGKTAIVALLKEAEKTIVLSEFKLHRVEKERKTVSVLLEETIDELQKKRKDVEAQNRELEIEAALERVRTVAMSMQKSEELISICKAMFTELKSLGFTNIRNAQIAIKNDEKQCYSLYVHSDFEEICDGEADYNSSGGQKLYQQLGKSADGFYEGSFTGDEMKEWRSWRRSLSPLRDPREETADAMCWYMYGIGDGHIGISTFNPVTKEQIEIVKRFKNVFELSYRRFDDLQKAEASAKEAIKQTALDRIRADIASMRTINDLDRITPLIWNELTILGVPFIRCGVFIMDDEQQLIHTFLSTPDGKAIAAFHIPYGTPGNIKYVISHWHNNQNYIDHWDEDAFTTFAKTLVQQGALTSAEQYLQTVPHGGFYLHFLPFLQGMLYVGNTNQLSEDEIKLIQSLADAFSTAYARYEDFNKLEAAKKQVDITLKELQATQKQLIQSEKMASMGELTAGIAHEIQNPLNFVNNFSEVNNELIGELVEEVEKKNYDEVKLLASDIKENSEKINHHGKRAGAIVKSMLEHSRVSSGQRELTDINKLADEYLRLSYHGLRAKDKTFNATMKTDFDESIEKIKVVPQDIGRVFLNLFNNAFYATNEKQKAESKMQNAESQKPKAESNLYVPIVTLSTQKLNDKIEIKVADNGNGIPQNIVDKIFQPFFTTKPTGEGTGLGLSLSYDIVKAHGGEIKVETKEGELTEFIIQLPL